MAEKEERTEIAPEKLSKILDVAQKRFARYGLSKTTMNDIAEDLGVSKASLYYYFPDKEVIFKKVVCREQADFCTLMNKVTGANRKVDALFKAYIENRTEYLKSLINLGQLTYEEFHAYKPLYSALGKDFFDKEKTIIKEILLHAYEKGEIIKVNFDEYASFFAHNLRSLRLYALGNKDLWESGNIDQEIKHEYLFFTKIFLKSIEKV
jgi:TetR/AcrR family transcriptional regulator